MQTHCCLGKAISITYLYVSACACALWVGLGVGRPACGHARVARLIQYETRCNILSSATSLTPFTFSILSHKGNDFRKKVLEHKTCVLIFSTNSFESFSL